MWMKKRYVLQYRGLHHDAVVAHDRRGRRAVQIDDGELREVDAVLVQNGRALSLRVNGAMHLIDLTPRAERGALDTTVRGRTLSLKVMDELHALAQQSLEQAGGGAISAEIPGVVVSVAVQEGQTVQAGDALLVLEAMKMQNEIAAPVHGVVEEIKVKTGQSVNAGDLLVVVAPEAGG